MAKEHVGHHLLRVRIRKKIFFSLQEVAVAETERTGEHVTVSDLVRQACVQMLHLHETMRYLSELSELYAELHEAGDDEDEEDDEADEDIDFEPFSVRQVSALR